MFDFIGDIHGYADKLIELLEKLGYTIKNGVYSHPTRKVFFIGDYIHNSIYYPKDEKPVFFGHYGLNGYPVLYRKNVCCLDYAVAKNGWLVAYRYDGEKELSNDKFTFV